MSSLISVADKDHKTDEATRVYSDTETTVRKPNCMNFCCDHHGRLLCATVDGLFLQAHYRHFWQHASLY